MKSKKKLRKRLAEMEDEMVTVKARLDELEALLDLDGELTVVEIPEGSTDGNLN
jgi:hypothetical protein